VLTEGLEFQDRFFMGNKLFVGGLAWATDDAGLRSAFDAFGTVTDSKVITDRETGRSRGFGFVTFSSDDEARTAQAEMDGASLDGRNIRVNEAQERSGGRGGGRGGGGGYGGGGGRGGGGGYGGGGGGGGYGGGGGGGGGGYGGGGGGGRKDRW
jgi:cold-inducible RNA-binding protein